MASYPTIASSRRIARQAQDRAHRIGQKKQVVVYRLVCSGTMEENILRLSERKMLMDHMLLSDQAGAAEAGEGSWFSMSEMWAVLRQGAEMVFRVDSDEAICDESLDRIIEDALESARRGAEGAGAGRPAPAEPPQGGAGRIDVAGTIFEMEGGMRRECDRVASFEECGWPALSESVNPGTLAAAGFFADPSPEEEDRASCFACGFALKDWEPEDDPMKEHAAFSPECPFVLGEDTGNVPLASRPGGGGQGAGGLELQGPDLSGCVHGEVVQYAVSKGLPQVRGSSAMSVQGR